MADEIPKIHYNQGSGSKTLDPKWWTYDDTEAHNHVIGCCRSIEERQTYRRRRNVMHARMYSNQFLAAMNSNIYARPQTPAAQEARVTLNVVKACIDTVSAKIAKNKPRPLFLTTRGNQAQRQRAKKLTQYVDGVFKDAKIYEHGQKSFRDCGIFGTGFVKLIPDYDKKRICAERVLPDEIVVDDVEALYGSPRTIYQRRWVHREVVLDSWGDTDAKRALIETCDAGGDNVRPDITPQGDMLYVVEAWHLPSGESAKDGKHVIAISNCTLAIDEYKKDYFPIFQLYWTPPVVGYYGAGIVEEICGLQIEINKLLRDIQQGQHRMCAPQIWIENSTHVNKPVTNEIGAIYRFTGQAPTFYAPSAMAAEVYNHVWNIYKRAFEIVGVSEMAATLRKPAGLESRAALREFNEIETERFALVAQAYERFYMDIAGAVVDMSRDLYEDAGELSVNVPGRKFIETVDWEEADMEADSYVMEVFPTALLPNTPSGRLDRVQEMMEAGLIDKTYAMSLLDFPDVENVVSLETASFENISMIIDDIIEKGKYRQPEQFMDLGLAVKMAQEAYLRGQTEGVEEERLELLRTFMKQTLTLMLASEKKPENDVSSMPPPSGPPSAPGIMPPAPVNGAAPPAPPAAAPPPMVQ